MPAEVVQPAGGLCHDAFIRAQEARIVFLRSVAPAACASQREPAQKMISDIEAAVSSASADAAKYVPDQLNDVQTKLDDLKTAFNAQDYKGVLARGPAVLAEAQGLAGAAAAKKADVMKALNDQWSCAGEQRAGRGDRRPEPHRHAGRSARTASSPKASISRRRNPALDDATSHWSKAQGAFGNGNIDEAVSSGKDAKSKLETVAGTLKVDLPGRRAPRRPRASAGRRRADQVQRAAVRGRWRRPTAPACRAGL